MTKLFLSAALIATAVTSPVNADTDLQSQIDALRTELETLRNAVFDLYQEDSPDLPPGFLEDLLEQVADEVLGNDANVGEDPVPADETRVLALKDWSFTPSTSSRYSAEVTFEIQNLSQKTVIMIDGVVALVDALGEEFARLELQRDVLIPKGDAVLLQGSYGSADFILSTLIA
jgi:hypothetical protein